VGGGVTQLMRSNGPPPLSSLAGHPPRLVTMLVRRSFFESSFRPVQIIPCCVQWCTTRRAKLGQKSPPDSPSPCQFPKTRHCEAQSSSGRRHPRPTTRRLAESSARLQIGNAAVSLIGMIAETLPLFDKHLGGGICLHRGKARPVSLIAPKASATSAAGCDSTTSSSGGAAPPGV